MHYIIFHRDSQVVRYRVSALNYLCKKIEFHKRNSTLLLGVCYCGTVFKFQYGLFHTHAQPLPSYFPLYLNSNMANLRANRNITILSIEKLCKALQCTPNDIVEILDESIL